MMSAFSPSNQPPSAGSPGGLIGPSRAEGGTAKAGHPVLEYWLARPQLTAWLAFVLAALLAASLIGYGESSRLEVERGRVTILASHAREIERKIEHALSATQTLAVLVRRGGGKVADFDEIARQMLPLYPGVAALQLAPDGIVRQSVPLVGHEQAIGHDLLLDPLRTKEAFLARYTGKLTLAGPFKLVQGGEAAAGRLPVFLDDAQGQPQFWGFVTALLKFPEVVNGVLFDQLVSQGLAYQLARVNPDSGATQIIAASSALALSDPVVVTLRIPNATWTINVAPIEGWWDPVGLSIKVALGLLFSLLLAVVARLLVQLTVHRRGLAQLVAQRTHKVLATQRQLRATLDAIPDFLFELDLDGRFHACHAPASDPWARFTMGLIGKTVLGSFAQPAAQTIMSALHEALERGNSHGMQFEHQREQSRRWFELSVSRKNTDATAACRCIVLARDITVRKRAEEELHLAASVFTHAREAILITSLDGTIVDVNEAFSRITGYSRDEVLGKNPRILSSGRQGKEYYASMWRNLAEQGHWYGEVWNRRKNGEVYAEMQTINAVRDEHGQVSRYVALFSDITAQKNHQDQLRHLAHFDALTGLPNRMLLAERLHRAIVQTHRRGTTLAVAYLDLDGFKAINDRHGHEGGDHLLIAVATRLKHALREGDTLARLGGDEFVAVLVDLDDAPASVPMLTRLLAAAAQPVQFGDLVLQVSASLGVTFCLSGEDVDADQLLRRADQAMYQAKLAGKNRYHIFDAAHDRSVRGHHESLERSRRALEQREFVLHYQPKVNMRTGEVVGAEALIRWQHPEMGLLLPGVFLPTIEDSPLAIDVGEWVIQTALEQVEQWRSAGLELPVSVNVGARQLQQGDFVERLRMLLAAHPDLDPSYLELELLETSALEDLVHVSKVIEDCRLLGVLFALDDFGTGYSSLTYLKRLPVTLLKIDQSFVRDMLDDGDDLAILEGVIGLARAFRRQVIAEGVETVEHGELLLKLGCDLAQGYGVARPMPARDLPAWVRAWQPDPAWGVVAGHTRVDARVPRAGAEPIRRSQAITATVSLEN
ncbi:EAL domain-containing protein [Rhodoferax sp.]|uniref:bifunctional diguanylate cyclase/phosphodiesterase n=1 Tax=Rhodoferax sp. TaxID=50421 RepID=UPI0027537946|nr:EAL domain-containing protein [Rhodoferax sp.]